MRIAWPAVYRRLKIAATEGCRKWSAYLISTKGQREQIALFLLGVGLLTIGLQSGVLAQDELQDHTTNMNTVRLDEAIVALLTYLEGSFGALVMVVAGIGAILSSAFGQYKAALGCLIISVGSFILRSFLHTFFNMEGTEQYE